jgi:hypothetical protein
MSVGGLPPVHGASQLNDGVGISMCADYAWVTSTTVANGAYFELDWMTSVTIGSFYVETPSATGMSGTCAVSAGCNVAGAQVQTWTGTAWNTVGSFSGKSGNIQFDINPPVMTTKLRLFNVVNSPGNGDARIWEWHVFTGQGCIPPAD